MPWALNSLARDVSGETFDELYDQWRAAEAGSAVARLVEVSAAGATKVDRITREGGNTGWPRRRPGTSESWFYYFDHESAPVYASVLTTGGDVERRFEVEGGAGAFGFTPDGDELVYSQSITFESSYRYLDLFAYHIPTKARRRLTEGERARDPAISPDGKTIAYVRNRAGTMELVVRPYPHTSGAARVLVSGLAHAQSDPAHWQQIATPHWSPDGRRIAFSWWRQSDGQRDLWIVDLDAPPDVAPIRLTDDFAVDLDPFWAEDGLIYFSSDRTGIYNVYAVEPETASVMQVSNVVDGLFTPHLSPDQRWVYAGAYGPDGFDLARFARPERYVDAQPSRLDELVAVSYPEVDASQFEEGPYRPARWLGPLLLKPELGVVTSGAGLGASVESYDPIGHHAWELAAGVTVGREIADRSANVGLSYSYGGLPVSVGVSGLARDYSRARSYFVSSDYLTYLERQVLGSLRLSYPFRGLIDTLSVSLRYDLDYRKFQDVPQTELDPMDLEPTLPQLGWFNSMGLALSYSNREAYPQSVTTSKGWSASVGFDVQDPVIGSDYRNLELNYGFDLYLQNPIWERHVLALLFDGAVTVSELDAPRRFAIGGNRPQDVFTSLVLQQQRREFVVRGFAPNITTGAHYQVVRGEYRFPILTLDEGLSTVPVFLRRLKGSLFLDHGGAYDGFLADADLLTGVGAELSLETVFAYYLFGNVRLGYARGLGPDGINELYFLFGGGF